MTQHHRHATGPACCARCREASATRWAADPGAELDLERVTPAGLHLHQLEPWRARLAVVRGLDVERLTPAQRVHRDELTATTPRPHERT